MAGYRSSFIRGSLLSLRILFCTFFSALSCTSVMPQGSCSSTPHTIWGMSGSSGPNWLPPESSPSWQQTKANQMSQYGGIPVCNSTNIIDNPSNGAGHWYTQCSASGYTCTGAPTPWPNYPSNNPNLEVTGVFCTSGSERESTLEGSWYADEEIQAGAHRNAAAAD